MTLSRSDSLTARALCHHGRAACWLVALTGGLGTASHASAQASLEGLGDLPGGLSSIAYGISGDGQTCVGASSNQGFRWTPSGGMVYLGDLPGGGVESPARDASYDGSVITGTSHSGTGYQAYRWTEQTGVVSIGLLPGTFLSQAYAISGDGTVIIGKCSESAALQEAFLWSEALGMVGLGDLPGGTYSQAYGVNYDGSVVVGMANYDIFSQTSEAFRWTDETGMVGLGDLPGGNFSSSGNGVSADGKVVVGGGSVAGFQRYEAFRWSSASGMVGLGYLPAWFNSVATATSGDGAVVVGRCSNADSTLYEGDAFIWTANDGMHRLWDVLVANGADPATQGWIALTYATGISDDGSSITGWGVGSNGLEAFRAVIQDDGCYYVDCDGSGSLDIDDFICFQTLFALGDPYADCDGDANLTIDDFICFQTLFAIGC